MKKKIGDRCQTQGLGCCRIRFLCLVDQVVRTHPGLRYKSAASPGVEIKAIRKIDDGKVTAIEECVRDIYGLPRIWRVFPKKNKLLPQMKKNMESATQLKSQTPCICLPAYDSLGNTSVSSQKSRLRMRSW